MAGDPVSERIAASLTREQQTALILHQGVHHWLDSQSWRAGRALKGRGLIDFEPDPRSSATILTGRGIAVRQAIKLSATPSPRPGSEG